MGEARYSWALLRDSSDWFDNINLMYYLAGKKIGVRDRAFVRLRKECFRAEFDLQENINGLLYGKKKFLVNFASINDVKALDVALQHIEVRSVIKCRLSTKAPEYLRIKTFASIMGMGLELPDDNKQAIDFYAEIVLINGKNNL